MARLIELLETSQQMDPALAETIRTSFLESGASMGGVSSIYTYTYVYIHIDTLSEQQAPTAKDKCIK